MKDAKEQKTGWFGKCRQGLISPFSIGGDQKGKNKQSLHKEGESTRGNFEIEKGNILPEFHSLAFESTKFILILEFENGENFSEICG